MKNRGEGTTGSGAGFVEVFGAPLYYEVVGEGHPLVLIHEAIGDSRMYDDQIDEFAKHYKVIRYDVHGYGKSGVPDVPYTDHDALRELLRALGIVRAYVLGMSNGGGIAIDFALAYPEMVDALIPMASAVGGYQVSEEVEQQWEEFGEAMAQGDVPRAIEFVLEMWVDGPKRAPEQVDPVVRECVRELVSHVLTKPESNPQPLEPPAISRLGEIQAPTLVIIGDGDQAQILEIAELLHEGIADAQKVVLPEVAHVLNMEIPDQFNRLVLDFLGGIPGAGDERSSL